MIKSPFDVSSAQDFLFPAATTLYVSRQTKPRYSGVLCGPVPHWTVTPYSVAFFVTRTEAMMETYLEIIKSTLNWSIEQATQSIESCKKYIAETEKEITEVEAIISAMDDTQPCPLCGSDMVNVAKIIKRNFIVHHSHGGENFRELFRMTNNRVPPTGYECQKCGLYQKDLTIQPKYQWDRDTAPDRSFALLIFKHYPLIVRVVMARPEASDIYLFSIQGQWYTFGEIGKDEVAERLQLASPQKPVLIRVAEKGYIYLILAESIYYKIGRTKDLTQRSSFFEIHLPFDFEIIHSFLADDMHKAERLLHQRFAPARLKGEWFNLNNEDVASIKSISEYKDSNFILV